MLLTMPGRLLYGCRCQIPYAYGLVFRVLTKGSINTCIKIILTAQATLSLLIAFIKQRAIHKFYMELSALVKEAKQGSEAAQKCLFDLLADKMLLHCRRYVKNAETAEEILLDGFYKFFKALPAFRYEGEAALYGWLKKIMINECLMHLRKKNVFTIVTESVAEEIPLEEDAISRLSAAEIFNIIVQLPVGYRTVFNLHAIEGMNHGEIASLLGISEGTSKSQLSKARSLLQKMLVQHGTEYAKQKNR
jgi:RNA polymerase sigma factor (sigma-70 family)